MQLSSVLVLSSVALTACAIGETRYDTVHETLHTPTAVKTCDSPFTVPDLSPLKACGKGGKNHCFDATKTAVNPTKDPACADGEGCFSDAFLTGNGAVPKTCTFYFNGKPGGCVKATTPGVSDNASFLRQDVCEADELCVPCNDPRNGDDTHICAPMGVHEETCAGGSGAAVIPCCHHAGVCINVDAAPEEQRDKLSRMSCPANKFCAPASQVYQEITRCHVLGASGVCIDTCFAGQMAPSQPLTQSVCQATEVCVPCAVAKGQGIQGCD